MRDLASSILNRRPVVNTLSTLPMDSQAKGDGWKAVVLLTPFQFMFGLVYAWGGMAPAIHAATSWSASLLDLMFSLTPLALLPAVLAGGRLVGRFAPERILRWALGCFAAGGLLALTSASPVRFAIGYAIVALGLGGGLSTAASIAVIHRVAPRAQGRLSGALLAIYGLSASVSGPLFLWLGHHAAWRIALAIVMAGYGIVAALCLTVLRPGPAVHRSKQDQASPVRPRGAWQPAALNMVLLIVAVPFGSAVFAAIGRIATQHGHAVGLGVAGASIMSAANGIGRFAGGVLADVSSIRVTWCVVLGLAACGYGANLADARLGAPVLFLLFAALTGLSFGALAGKLPALAARTSPSNPAFVFSIYFGTFALGSFGGPFLSAEVGLPITMTVFGSMATAAFVARTAVRCKLCDKSVQTVAPAPGERPV
jgi:predicted MFS family arabinose efflux permease